MADHRLWPKPRRFIPRVRFSVRGLLVGVLVAGLICGGFARWYARRAQRQALIAQLQVQRQVTGSAKSGISEAIADLIDAGRSLSFTSDDTFDPDRDQWTAQLDAYEVRDGRRIPLIVVEVSGGREGDALRPITIKAAGASLEGPFLDRLIRDYRARGWRHEVIALPAADK